jgi:hypothetical protein
MKRGVLMQNQIVEKQRLLNELGHLANPGYALKPYFEYSRKDIKASVWRIKEWDYYAALNQDYGVSFTIADLGYSYLISAVFFDFKNATCLKKTKIGWFSFGKLNMPTTSVTGNVSYHGSGFDFDFLRLENHRKLLCKVKNFLPGKDLESELLIESPNDDTIVMATPWKQAPKAFYYNQKINCMATSGFVRIGDEEHRFDPTQTFTVLDWGRGVWTYKNTWYWGSASGIVNGKRFGFNIGYGFGDTSKASENILFYDGVGHKLGQVTFNLDTLDYKKPWIFTSNDHRLELTMEPMIDRQDDTNFIIIKNLGHQVFGKFHGFVILNDGTKLEITDLLGFAEQITNHY